MPATDRCRPFIALACLALAACSSNGEVLESESESRLDSGRKEPSRELEPESTPSSKDLDALVRRWVSELPEELRIPPRTELPDAENAYSIWSRIAPGTLDVETPLWERDDLSEDDQQFLLDGFESPGASLPPTLVAMLKEAFRENADAWSTLLGGVAAEKCLFPENRVSTEGAEESLRVLLTVRDGALYARLRAHVAASEGRWEPAFAEVDRIFALAATLRRPEPLLIDDLISRAVESIGCDLLRSLAAFRDVPLELLERTSLPEFEPDELLDARRAELARFASRQFAPLDDSTPLQSAVSHILDIAEIADPDERDRAERAWLRMLEGHPHPFSRQDTIRLLAEHVQTIVERCRHPWNPEGHDEPLVRELEPWPSDLRLVALATPLEVNDELPPSSDDEVRAAATALRSVDNVLGKALVAAYFDLQDDGIVSVDSERHWREHTATLRATRLVLALVRHERAHGVLPETLAETGLDPSELGDPFTRVPEGVFGYDLERRQIWSGGIDGRDDGGVEADELGDATGAPNDLVWAIPELR